MGQVLQAGVGQAPARQAALRAGLPVTTSATTINRVCGSGLKAIMLAAAEIRAGDADVVVAGGMESMNQAPYLLPGARFGYRLGDAVVKDATVLDGLWCAIEDCHMGTHAERVAAHDHVSRADQDAFALESHRRAIAAIDDSRFDAELVPVTVRDAKGRETVVTADEGPRRDTTIEALARLRPAFALPEPEHRASGRRARSPPAMHRGSPTAPRRPSWPANGPSSGSGCNRWPGSSATPRLRSSRNGCSLPRSRGCASSPDPALDRGLRPRRDQRGVRGPGPGRRPRARLRLVQGQRQRRGDRARPPDRGERRASRRDAPPRAAAAPGSLRPGDPLPRRGRLGGDGLRAR